MVYLPLRCFNCNPATTDDEDETWIQYFKNNNQPNEQCNKPPRKQTKGAVITSIFRSLLYTPDSSGAALTA